MAAGKLTIVEPFAITNTANITVGGNAANMTSPDPKEIYQFSSTAIQEIVVDLGSARLLDSIFIGYTNATDGFSRVYTCDNIAGANPVLVRDVVSIRAADAVAVRSSKLVTLTNPVTTRFLRLHFAANTGPALQVGILAVGLSFSANYDREWGSGRRLVDTSKVTQLLGGGFGRQQGARKAAYSWTFGDLTDAETEALWAMNYRLGISDPLIVAERDGTAVGANEQLHYGLFTRMDQFERREHNATKWSLEIEEWI